MSLYHSVKVGNLTIGGNLFLAPVAGYTDMAGRSVCIDCGADFTYTEMVSSEALYRGSLKTSALMRTLRKAAPYAVQLFGSDPRSMSVAVDIVGSTTTASMIDINCGCPVPKITKSGAGSALMLDIQRFKLVVGAAVKASAPYGLPVTVKLRSGWDNDNINYLDISRAAIDIGVSAITLHPRTRAQGYSGHSSWEHIRSLVETLGDVVPIFGSGDVFTPEAARDMLIETGVSAVMFARGAMGHPTIFRETRALLETGSYTQATREEVAKLFRKEYMILVEDMGEEVASRLMRKRAMDYTKGIAHGAILRNKIAQAATVADYEKILEEMTDFATM